MTELNPDELLALGASIAEQRRQYAALGAKIEADVARFRSLVERGTSVPPPAIPPQVCSPETIKFWESGRCRPSRVFAQKIADLEGRLRDRKLSVDDELAGDHRPVAGRPLPLVANVVVARVEGDQALLSFSVKVPGEDAARSVAEILVPVSVLAAGRIRVS